MSKEIRAEITGTVWKVHVAAGHVFAAGEELAILESMKMEIPVEPEEGGTVAEVRIREGQAIQEGDVMFVVE
ncbi:biotin/lipoyl-binding carrier protein [Myxococcota bacterium]|nr:biotin/lipoyl-binding carrier protein [Myxococcota bacterium]